MNWLESYETKSQPSTTALMFTTKLWNSISFISKVFNYILVEYKSIKNHLSISSLDITISFLFLYQLKIYMKIFVTSNKCGRLSSNPLIQSSYNFLLIEANVLKAKPNIKHNNPTNMHSEKNFYLFPFMRNGLSDCYSITESAHS